MSSDRPDMTLPAFVDWFRADLAYKAPELWPDRLEWFFAELVNRHGNTPEPKPGPADRQEPGLAEWVILELLGHRRLAGWLTEQQIAGASFLRLDIPGGPGQPAATQLYSPGSVYAITPTTEEIARQVATRSRPAPVQRWELPAAPARQPDPDPGGDEGLGDYGGPL